MKPEDYMQIALKLAKKASKKGEVPVGCVVVKGDKIIAKAHNRKEKTNNATRHAEIEAISKASKKLKNWWLEDCDLYVTLEPCPMCAGAMINARVSRVFFGAYEPKSGACGSVLNLFNEGEFKFNHKVEATGGILENECALVLSDFFKAKRKSTKSVAIATK
ncbi:MAG: tRNA adenosine(34) deaminase TadA [Firmicutes bacterium]|nr:tRNA adenosine(34) deaminase TadA [Bacillota bacterium]